MAIRAEIRLVSLAILCSVPLMFTHAWSGLETLLFTAAVTGSLLLLLCALKEVSLRFDGLLYISLLIASLVRPEGAALAGCYAVALLSARWRAGRASALKSLGLVLALFVLPGTTYFLWRFGYYGRLLPNTFYAKLEDQGINGRSLLNFVRFAYTYLGAPAASVGCLWLGKARAKTKQANAEKIFAPAFWGSAAFFSIVLALYARSNLMMNYAHRFYVPFFPMMLIGLAVLAERAIARDVAPRRSPAVAFALLALLAQPAIHFVKFRSEIDYVTEYRTVLADCHVRAAEYIDTHLPKNEWITCYLDAGVIPYLTRRKATDFGRLNDTFLARRGLTESEAVDYFFRANPGAVAFTSREWDQVSYTPEAEAITSDPRFRHYTLARKFRTSRTAVKQRYHQFVFFRNDLLPSPELTAEGD